MSEQRPNLLYIVADQWRGDCLGLLGGRHPVMTPHLDQLACEGTLLSRTYADCPICMPQRMTLLTGRTGAQMDVLGNFMSGPRPPVDPQETLPAVLTREAGYQTQACGKMHFYPDRARYGFEHVALHPNDYVNWLEDEGLGGLYRGHGLGGNELYPATAATDDRHYHTTWTIDEAIRFLRRRDPDCPFALFVVFEAPHSPFDPPAPYDRMYDSIRVPEPVTGDWSADPEQLPRILLRTRLAKKVQHIRPEVLAETRRRYYGQISQIDYHLGRLFGELCTQGLWNNTAVAFTADHGEHLGDHGLFAKYSFLESSARVPGIIRLPASLRSGDEPQVIGAATQTADLCPTLLEIAGLAADRTTPDAAARSLLPALRGESPLPEDRIVCGLVGGSAMATDGQWKYVWFANPGRELLTRTSRDGEDLYDLSSSSDPAAKAAKRRLHEALVAFLRDRGRPEADGGALWTTDRPVDETVCRRANQCAWRGPMRYGKGY